MTRIAISRTGRFVAFATPDAVEVVDALGTSPRVRGPRGDDFGFVGNALWVLDGASVKRVALGGDRALDPIALPFTPTMLRPVSAEAAAWVFSATRGALVTAAGCEELETSPCWPLTGRRAVRDAEIIDAGRGAVARIAAGGEVRGAWPLFGARALAVLVADDGDEDRFVVCRADGAVIHRVVVPRARAVAVADQRGTAVVIGDASMVAIDLRYGRVTQEGEPRLDVVELAIDADGQYVALAGVDGERVHVPITELFAGAARPAKIEEPAIGQSLSATTPTEDAMPPAEPAPEASAPSVELPDLLPLALGRPITAMAAPPVTGFAPYGSPVEHLGELVDLVAAMAGRAIAIAWHTGRLSAPTETAQPFEREVQALLGASAGLAAEQVRDADARVAAIGARVSGRALATLGAGAPLPFVALAHEHQLSPIATQVLAVALAPVVRGTLARLFGILSNDESRGVCDVMLIEEIVAGEDRARAAMVAQELAEDAPLLRQGLLRVTPSGGGRQFAQVSVDEVLVEHLRGGAAVAGLGDAATLRTADRRLDELMIAPAVMRSLIVTCAEPRTSADPLRVVVRGRRGSGRTSLIAALAAKIGRGVTAIDCARMPRDGRTIAARLRLELIRAMIRRTVPVVSGLAGIDPTDLEGQDLVRQALRAHPGPVILRAAPEDALPIEPGHATVTLPALTETERAAAWRAALVREGVPCADPEALAARYRLGPGTVVTVVRATATRRRQESVAPELDAGPMLDDSARQHVTTRLDRVATHVSRLASWEQVALPDDLLDSLREFIGRIRHRKTVYDTWGFDKAMATSRGLTALFYGPPGTGKSMVAGLIARELGLELYRIDLARMVSKWIGETEKNLAEVFDAAEDGQVVILFDEADSLFAKRTEVKSSVDRYANLEVNYLLQRLDSFEGIAILTTNLEGSIDPAFKRRMSLRLNFPFPDEEMRTRLWAAHVPAEMPLDGALDLAELAHRFPLSGGYIRNSALRAAFLAAQEDVALSQRHLLRAIQLEYRELGKLSSSGRME